MKNYYDRTRPQRLTPREWRIILMVALISTVLLFTAIGWRA